MKGANKFCMIVWPQIEDSLLVLQNGSCEHTANDLPTFSPQKRNLEIGPSERLLPVFETKNWILKNGLCERAFRLDDSLKIMFRNAFIQFRACVWFVFGLYLLGLELVFGLYLVYTYSV